MNWFAPVLVPRTGILVVILPSSAAVDIDQRDTVTIQFWSEAPPRLLVRTTRETLVLFQIFFNRLKRLPVRYGNDMTDMTDMT
jgi:hypothetical protein